MMRVFIRHLFLLILFFLGLVTLISEGSLYFLRHSSFYKPSYVANSLDHSTYDYIVLGSSIGLTTLNTKVIDSLSGFSGVNLSMDNTGIGAHCLMLEHFLAEGNSTSYCILSSSAASLNSNYPEMGTNDYRFLPYVRKSYVSSYFRTQNDWSGQLINFSKYLSFLGVSYYNAEIFYPSLMGMVKPEKRNRFDEHGNYSYPVLSHYKKNEPEHKKINIELKNPYLNRLDSICRFNNIKLIVYLSPMENVGVEVFDSIIPIINHSDLLKDNSLFYDAIHVNSKGREAVSEVFVEELDKLITTK